MCVVAKATGYVTVPVRCRCDPWSETGVGEESGCRLVLDLLTFQTKNV